MKLHNNLRKFFTIVCLVISVFLFSGCVSTEKSENELECRPQTTEECTVDEEGGEEGEDRGYDPCLVNKNLPVCKT